MNTKIEINSNKKVYSRITLKISRSDGTVRKVQKYDGHSLVETFWKFIYNNGFKKSDFSATDIFGGSATWFNSRSPTCLGGSGEYTGLIVGSGNSALSVTQTQLDSMVIHGNSAGELSYAVNSIFSETNNRKATISRNFENLSGGTISVNEIGLTMNETAAPTGPYLIARDVLPASEDVLDTETLSVSYEIFFTKGLKNYQAFFKIIDGEADFTYVNSIGNNLNEESLIFEVGAGSNENRFGILVGAGNTPVNFNDFNLENKIPAGSNAGQLNSTPVTISAQTVDAGVGTVSFDIKRSFINNTDDPIQVSEMGLFSIYRPFTDTYYLLDRVVLPAPITIKAGEQRAAKWLFRYSI